MLYYTQCVLFLFVLEHFYYLTPKRSYITYGIIYSYNSQFQHEFFSLSDEDTSPCETLVRLAVLLLLVPYDRNPRMP